MFEQARSTLFQRMCAPLWETRKLVSPWLQPKYELLESNLMIELICCNKLGIQSVASIALAVTLPLCLYKEG
jgi:hypothetical protein